MRPLPPWRWSIWGPWPLRETELPQISDEQIRPLAERLGKQRPWLSDEENWRAAERALRQKPWRPWVIRFCGEKERSGWDWADLLLKVSVPVLILALSTAYSIINSSRQETASRQQKESDVIVDFIKAMQPLVLDKNLDRSAIDSEVRGIARGLTLAALSQVNNPERKKLIIRFLLDSGLNTKPGNLFSLSEANLTGVELGGANLMGVDLGGANLRMANLVEANLRGADLRLADLRGSKLNKANLRRVNLRRGNLRGAILSGADISGADLSGADLRGAIFEGASLRKVDLSEALFSGADIRRAPLRATLRVVVLTRADLRGVDISGVDLRGADLRGADLRGADLRGTDLRWANLSGANVSKTNLNMANLSGAYLRKLKWSDETIWPQRKYFKGAKSIPQALVTKIRL